MHALIRPDFKFLHAGSANGKQWASATQIAGWKGAEHEASERGDILIHRVSDMNDAAQVVKCNT